MPWIKEICIKWHSPTSRKHLKWYLSQYLTCFRSLLWLLNKRMQSNCRYMISTIDMIPEKRLLDRLLHYKINETGWVGVFWSRVYRIYLVVEATSFFACMWKILLIFCLFVSAPIYRCVWLFINRFYKLQWGRQFRQNDYSLNP